MSKILGSFLLLAPLLIGANLAQSVNSQFIHLTGHFSDEDLAKGASPTTLPRTYLYDSNNRLVPQEEWPTELAEVKKHGGDAYCCVSEHEIPNGSNEPPADCVRAVYGTNVAANFSGLKDSTERPIVRMPVPR